jgi:plasmid stabilization system protein ParE
MTGPVFLAPAARLAFQEAARWLACRNPDAARKLRQAAAEAARRRDDRPLAGRQQPELVGPHNRLWSLSSFPDGRVDDPRPVPPPSLRVLHTSRDLPPLQASLRASADPPDDALACRREVRQTAALSTPTSWFRRLFLASPALSHRFACHVAPAGCPDSAYQSASNCGNLGFAWGSSSKWGLKRHGSVRITENGGRGQNGPGSGYVFMRSDINTYPEPGPRRPSLSGALPPSYDPWHGPRHPYPRVGPVRRRGYRDRPLP